MFGGLWNFTSCYNFPHVRADNYTTISCIVGWLLNEIEFFEGVTIIIFNISKFSNIFYPVCSQIRILNRVLGGTNELLILFCHIRTAICIVRIYCIIFHCIDNSHRVPRKWHWLLLIGQDLYQICSDLCTISLNHF